MSLEGDTERRCCARAVRMGCQPIKLGGFVVGLPDRVFLLPGGRTWLVEFKSPDGEVSARQAHQFRKLAKLGHPVEVIRSFARFKDLLADQMGRPRPTPVVQIGLDLP